MIKHTPGPFAVISREHVHAICCIPTRRGEHAEVAFIPVAATPFPDAPPGDLSAGQITAQQRSPEELLGNARLFAAAPDLLAAVRAILFQVIQGKVLERDACITQARAALARVE